jgi:NAD-dependent DNA ligase
MPETECKDEICFTGFNKLVKAELMLTADKHRFEVRSNVSRNLNYLCCGPNAGHVKIKKAKKIGAKLINEVEFRQMINDPMGKAQ